MERTRVRKGGIEGDMSDGEISDGQRSDGERSDGPTAVKNMSPTDMC